MRHGIVTTGIFRVEFHLVAIEVTQADHRGRSAVRRHHVQKLRIVERKRGAVPGTHAIQVVIPLVQAQVVVGGQQGRACTSGIRGVLLVHETFPRAHRFLQMQPRIATEAIALETDRA